MKNIFLSKFIILASLLTSASFSYAQNEVKDSQPATAQQEAAAPQEQTADEEQAVQPVSNVEEVSSSPDSSESADSKGDGNKNEGNLASAKNRSSKKMLLARTKDFNRALNFDIKDLQLSTPELDYDLTLEEGSALRLGNVLLSEKTLFFSLLPLKQAHPHLSKILSSEEADEKTLIIKYPEQLIQQGVLEVITRTGNVVWSYEITEKMRESWKAKLSDWRKGMKKAGLSEKEIGKGGVFAVSFAINGLKEKLAPFENLQDNFRFCLNQKNDGGSARLCSQWYGVRGKGSNLQMGLVRVAEVEPRVLLNNQAAASKNTLPVSVESPTIFFAELKKGQSYEFLTTPSQLEIVDVADTPKKGLYRVVGVNTRPTNPTVLLNPDRYTDLTLLLRFQDTIGDFRKYWAAAVNAQSPHLFVPGKSGGVFKQNLALSQVPSHRSRPYLHRHAIISTYSEEPVVKGQKLPEIEISTTQKNLKIDTKDKSKFTWTMLAPKKGDYNRSYLDIIHDNKQYRAYHEVFRGYSSELSGRFTGVASGAGFLLMGEVAYNKWFEDLFGWDHFLLSKQRWGVSAKYFQAFNKLKVDNAGNTAALDVLTFDLKYRTQQGLWGRDETLGAIVSYQNVNYDQLKAPMLGVGAFWARSMPKVFDDLFNYLPYMNYPKFVDMEFIFYPVSMNVDTTLQGNFALNFHGKVLWTKTFFGEAGFGLKRYAFQDVNLNKKAALDTFYGTVGLGINF